MLKYRPISLLSNLDKVIEKLMHKRVIKFSTAHAIIKLIQDVEQSLDNKQSVCAVFIDLQKAFDTVNHNILLNKLSHYGIGDTANNWFSSYLANRNQFVTINGFYSDLRNVRLEMSQGSVQGPILFLLYIDDLHNAIKFPSPFHFVDDTCILNKQNSVDKINKTLNEVLKELSFWLNANKIVLNATKTKVILFKNKTKTNLSKLNLKICSKKLHPIESARYLGVIVDENLNWKNHVNDISHKLIRGNAILYKIRNFIKKGTWRTVYFAIFHSYINYVPIA